MIHHKTPFALAMAVLMALSVPAYSKDKAVESIWAASPMTIDGIAQDWDDAPPIFDKLSQAQYALKNDGQNLFIIMVLRNRPARSTIAYTGMKIFLGAGEKKVKDAGVLFLQKQLTPDELIASLENKGEVVTDERKAEIRKQKSYSVFLEEAIVPKKGAAPSEAEAKLEPALFRSTQKGEVGVYEFKIPLSRIGQTAGAVQPGGAVKVGFEWGGMTKEVMKNVMADRASSGAVARQGASEVSVNDRSGDGEGGGGDFSQYNRDPNTLKHSFWIDVKLAAKGS